MILLLLGGQMQPPGGAYRYSGTGTGTVKFYGTALSGVRHPHPIAHYEVTVSYGKIQYEHLDREGT